MRFDHLLDPAAWFDLSDPVMGGVSRSSLSREGGVAVFSGLVSLDRGGGFASVRSTPGDHDLSSFSALALRLRGDGKRYGLRLRTTAAFDGVTYQAAMATIAGEAVDLVLPWAAFRPQLRGVEVRGHPPLDPARVRTFGLIIGERQAGPFRLEIESLAAVPGG